MERKNQHCKVYETVKKRSQDSETPQRSKFIEDTLFFFFLQHTTAINQISIDQSGDYVASCSDDGRVSTDHDRSFTCNIDSQ